MGLFSKRNIDKAKNLAMKNKEKISSTVTKTTDTIAPTEAVRLSKNIRVITIAGLIGEAIARTAKEESVSSLFD